MILKSSSETLTRKLGRPEDGESFRSFGVRWDRRMNEWYKENGLILIHTFFEPHLGNMFIWKSHGHGCQNQIAFILIKERFRSSVQMVRTKWGANCDNDQILLIKKVRLKLKTIYRKKTASSLKSKLQKLDNDIRLKFCKYIMDLYYERPQSGEKDEWKFLQNAHVKSENVGKGLRMTRTLHRDQKAALRVHGELGDWIDILKGILIYSTCVVRNL